MFSFLRTTVSRLSTFLPKYAVNNQSIAMYHILTKTPLFNTNFITNNIVESRLLAPTNLNVVPNCGFKVKGRLRRRCKDCYFVMRQERLYVICKTHPRHKQMAMKPKEKNTWILTAATQGKVRPW